MSWLAKIEALAPGCPVEFNTANHGWEGGYTVVRNGGHSYWKIEDGAGQRYDVWIEQIRLPGQEEAWS